MTPDNNLANQLSGLYAATGERSVLEEAVGVARRAVEATPATSTDLPALLSTLAAELSGLYEATGERSVLEEAVGVARRAVEATPATSTDLPALLSTLAAELLSPASEDVHVAGVSVT